MGKRGVSTILSAALHIVQAICSLAVLAIVPWKLFHVSVNTSNLTDPSLDTSCLLDTGKTSTFLPGSRFCIALIVFAVAALLFSAIFSCAATCFKCLTANACGLSGAFTIVADIVLAAAWGVAFALCFQRGRQATDAGLPNTEWRNGVIAATFFGSVSYALDAIIVCCGIAGGSSS
jgi:hypothetical protein